MNQYDFTPLAYKVYAYMTNNEYSDKTDNFTNSTKINVSTATKEDIDQIFEK